MHLRAFLVLAVVALCAWIFVLFLQLAPEEGGSPAGATSPGTQAAPATAVLVDSEGGATRVEIAADPEPPAAPDANGAERVEGAGQAPHTHVLRGILRDPSGSPIDRAGEARFFVDGASWPCTPERSASIPDEESWGTLQDRFATLEDIEWREVNDLPSCEYRLAGIVPGFRRIRVDLAEHRHAEVEIDVGNAEEVEQDLVLVPLDGLTVRLSANGGRPFASLAAELGMQADEFDAIPLSVWRSSGRPPREDSAVGSHVPRLEPEELESLSLPGDAIAWTRLDPPPPCWIGLQFGQRFLEWKGIALGESEVLFELGAEDLVPAFGRVRLRVVSAESGRPLTDARVSLFDEFQARSLAEHIDRVPDANGAVFLENVPPGAHDLVVEESEHSLWQDHIVVQPGADLDLGALALFQRAPIFVEVVDDRGSLVPAEIVLVPLVPGAMFGDLESPSSVTRATSGQVELGSPSRRSLVFARELEHGARHGPARRSATRLLDPATELPASLVLEVRDARHVELGFASLRSGRVEFQVEDRNGIVVMNVIFDVQSPPILKLPPGDYRARLLGPDGREICAVDFAVGSEALRVEFP